MLTIVSSSYTYASLENWFSLANLSLRFSTFIGVVYGPNDSREFSYDSMCSWICSSCLTELSFFIDKGCFFIDLGSGWTHDTRGRFDTSYESFSNLLLSLCWDDVSIYI